VENVHFGGSERVDVALDEFERLEVTRDVDVESAPWETRLVFYDDAGKDVGAVGVGDELDDCF
jgi:hypothetical protein